MGAPRTPPKTQDPTLPTPIRLLPPNVVYVATRVGGGAWGGWCLWGVVVFCVGGGWGCPPPPPRVWCVDYQRSPIDSKVNFFSPRIFPPPRTLLGSDVFFFSPTAAGPCAHPFAPQCGGIFGTGFPRPPGCEGFVR